MQNIKIVRVDKNLPIPRYQTSGASGMDLYSSIDCSIRPTERVLIPTGIKLKIPEGYEVQIRPRSGLALNYGISVLNTPGSIDSDYTGEIGVILVNHADVPFVIKKGDRIAQAIFAKVYRANIVEVECLEETERGESGFGSTGREF